MQPRAMSRALVLLALVAACSEPPARVAQRVFPDPELCEKAVTAQRPQTSFIVGYGKKPPRWGIYVDEEGRAIFDYSGDSDRRYDRDYVGSLALCDPENLVVAAWVPWRCGFHLEDGRWRMAYVWVGGTSGACNGAVP